MLLADARTMRDADERAIHVVGIPSTLLMTNAAAAVGRAAASFMKPGGRALVFCGPGNNGGDGLAAAAWLLLRGYDVRAFLVGERAKMTRDSCEMARRLYEIGGVLEDFCTETDYSDAFQQADVIIDALFGIGLSRPLGGAAALAVDAINTANVPVVSADIPSGVNADTGEIMGNAVYATKTVTFSMAKPGHFSAPACVCTGELEIAPIGIPAELLHGCGVQAVTADDLVLPPRNPLAHKGDFGKLLLIGGSVGYTGAPTLCAKAALRCGAGLVSLGVPEPIYGITAVKNDEAMPFPLAADENGKLSPSSLPLILGRLEKMNAAVIGPGLGRSESMRELICAIVTQSRCPTVLDADALNAIGDCPEILLDSLKPMILTPHEGEFVRLGGLMTGDRTQDAIAFAKKYGCVLVLKGKATVCAFPDGEAYINTSGGPALAKGGSGDVLSGMIAALICRLPLKRAVTTAVWLHGRAGDLCAQAMGEDSVLASDVINAIPRAMQELQKR